MKTVFEMEPGNKHSTAKKNEQIFKGKKESDFYVRKVSKKTHFTIVSELVKFDPKTGKKLSRPQIQTLSPQDMQMMNEANFFQGKEMEILHDPTIEIQQIAEKAAAEKAAAAAKKEEPKK